MQCDKIREAISARIDGEDPGLPDGMLDAHLGVCADCRAWQQQAHAMTRRARLGGSFLDRDLTPRLLAAAPRDPARRREITQRAALAAVSIAQLLVTIPLLFLGHDHDAGTHAAHELGSFDLALAAAFAVGAVRPALSAGLAWPCAIAASGLTVTAIIDLFGGQALGTDEAQHLIAVAGAMLLIWQARTGRADVSRATVAGDGSGEADPVSQGLDAGADTVIWLDSPGRPADGGDDAARLTGPAVAARQGGSVHQAMDRSAVGEPVTDQPAASASPAANAAERAKASNEEDAA